MFVFWHVVTDCDQIVRFWIHFFPLFGRTFCFGGCEVTWLLQGALVHLFKAFLVQITCFWSSWPCDNLLKLILLGSNIYPVTKAILSRWKNDEAKEPSQAKSLQDKWPIAASSFLTLKISKMVVYRKVQVKKDGDNMITWHFFSV